MIYFQTWNDYLDNSFDYRSSHKTINDDSGGGGGCEYKLWDAIKENNVDMINQLVQNGCKQNEQTEKNIMNKGYPINHHENHVKLGSCNKNINIKCRLDIDCKEYAPCDSPLHVNSTAGFCDKVGIWIYTYICQSI